MNSNIRGTGSSLRDRRKATAIRKAVKDPVILKDFAPRQGERIAKSILRPRGLSLGLKYAVLTTLAIGFASMVLVILVYIAVHKVVEEGINEDGIRLVKVISAFDFEFWEGLKENNPLELINSPLAETMGIRTPSIFNLIITDLDGNTVVSIRPPGSVRIDEKGVIKNNRVDLDNINIKECDYYEEDKKIRTRLFTKAILDKNAFTKGYVQLYLSAEKIDQVLDSLLGLFFLLAAVAIFIGGIMGYWMGSQVTRPVQELMSSMQIVSRGVLSHRVRVTTRDEIGVLGNMFNQMTEDLKMAHERELETKALEHELNIAHEIQTNLLPKKVPVIPDYDIAAYYRASKEVGGDYYDIIQVDENNLGFVVADVSGKGVPGSMVMTMTRSLIRMEAKRNTSPADILSKVNRNLVGDIRRGMFITALYFILNLKSRTIHVSSAGHNPMVLWRGTQRAYALINPNGIALGFDRGPVFERTIKEQLIQLHPQDRIVIYTDGVVEAMNPDDEEFGNDHFYTLIGQLSLRNSKLFIDSVVKKLDAHQDTAPQHDDITLLSVRVTG